MKPFLLASLFSVLLVPHFSYAENLKKSDNHARTSAAIAHHRAHHVRSHSKSSDTQPVNINAATAVQLATLKGIGPKKAAAIVAYREAHGAFKNIDGLAKVRGIGLKSVARLQTKNPGRLVVNTAEKMS